MSPQTFAILVAMSVLLLAAGALAFAVWLFQARGAGRLQTRLQGGTIGDEFAVAEAQPWLTSLARRGRRIERMLENEGESEKLLIQAGWRDAGARLLFYAMQAGLPVGAAMLSVLLTVAFLSRQVWGVISDRIGGIRTALVSSFMQAAAISGYLFVQQQSGLFTVSIAFGLGFSALIPAYVLAVRELFPPQEAHWRVPITLMMTGSGMATGGWLAGFLFDRHGSYDLPFAVGVGANVLNLGVLATLTWLLYSTRARPSLIRPADRPVDESCGR